MLELYVCVRACVCVCLSAIISTTEKVDFNETGREHRSTGAQLSDMGDARSCGVKVISAKHFRITRLCMTLDIKKLFSFLTEIFRKT